jgi:hypothetical protein
MPLIPPWFYDQPKPEHAYRATDACSPGTKVGHTVIYGNGTHMWCEDAFSCGQDAKWVCPGNPR